MILILAEKKNLAEAIGVAIGGCKHHGNYYEAGDYHIMWCSGHIMRMKSPKEYAQFKDITRWSFSMLPLFPDKIEKVPVDGKEQSVKAIADKVKEAEYVIHAGDPDREGQVIVDEVLEYIKYKGRVDRLLVNDMNTPSIQRALENIKPNSEFYNQSRSGVSRQIADWKFGMNLSPAFSVALGMSTGVGRVQTPVLKIVVDRDEIIEKFGKLMFYNPLAHVSHENGRFDAEWVSVEGTPSMDGDGRILDKSVAELIANKSTGTGRVLTYNERESVEKQPLGFDLPKMQSEASRRFGLSSKKVMEICQSLYDIKKVATYPRSSCQYLPDDHIDMAPSVLDAIRKMIPDLAEWCDKADLSIRSPIWNQKEVDAASHHAISPTENSANLTPDEMRIYRLLCERFLLQWMPECKYIRVRVEVGDGAHKYKATGRIPQQEGWRDLFGKAKAPVLPRMIKDDPVDIDVEVKERETKPPARFNDGSIISIMTNIHKLVTDPKQAKILRSVSGIGTAATRDSIIERLLHHKLIERKKEKGKSVIISTDKGRTLIRQIEAAGAAKSIDPVTTAIWENALNKIERGEISDIAFNGEQEKFILKMIDHAKGVAPDSPVCPECGGEMIKSGKDIKFWSCASYPKCKGVIDIADGPACPDCGKKTVRRKRKRDGAPFYMCQDYSSGCKVILNIDKNGKVSKSVPKTVEYGGDCPKCGKKLIKRQGKKGPFYGCSGYPECKHAENIR